MLTIIEEGEVRPGDKQAITQMPTKMGVKHKRRNDVLHGNESDKLETMQYS